MTTADVLKLNQSDEQLVGVMQALSDKTRFKMFKLMLERRDLCVSQIAEVLNISVPAVSQHFRIFELVGLVGKRRYGQRICYELKEDNRLVDELKLMLKEDNHG